MRYHVFLSPHLDDVVLSCGGLLAHLTDAGASVMVLSIFTGLPPTDRPLSPFAAALHQLWGNQTGAYAARRAEDTAALAKFGLTPHWLDRLDCIYRGDLATGTWFYPDDTALFGALHPAEENLPHALATHIRAYLAKHVTADAQISFYVPLAVGNHVDHQLVNRAAAQLIQPTDRLFFCEDYPYIQRQPADLTRAKQQCRTIWGIEKPLRAQAHPLTAHNLRRKLDAIAAYRSQLDILFGGEAAMRHDVSAFFGADGASAETLWQKET